MRIITTNSASKWWNLQILLSIYCNIFFAWVRFARFDSKEMRISLQCYCFDIFSWSYKAVIIQLCFFQLFNLFLASFSSFIFEPTGIFFLSFLSLLFSPFPTFPYPHPLPIFLPSPLVLLLREQAYLYAKPTAISNIWIIVLTLRGEFLRYNSDVFCEQLHLYKSHWHMYFLNIGLSMYLSTDNYRFSPGKGWASPPSCWTLANPIGVEEETQNIWKSPKTPFHS